MSFGTFESDKSYLINKFRNPVFSPDSGLDNETVKKKLTDLAEKMEGQPHPVIKAKAFACVCENIQIDVSPHDWFPAFGCWNRYDRPLSPLIGKWEEEVNSKYLKTLKTFDEQNLSGAARMWKDFDHSVPDWDAVLSLGFPGLRERAREHRARREEKGELTDGARAYFDGIEITYTAILGMLERFRNYALAHAGGNRRVMAVADSLDALIHGPPSNIYEVLHLTYLFFMLGEHIDRFQVRSLGNLDLDL